jgi:putative oxidoreductase
MDVIFLVGRILLGQIFILSGYMAHIRGREQGVAYARGYNAPAPELLVPLSGIVAILGGLSVILGVWGDVGALLIVGFLAGITPIMHAFWKETDPMTRIIQMSQFQKNVALIGAALVVFYLFNQLQGAAGLTITDPLFDRG